MVAMETQLSSRASIPPFNPDFSRIWARSLALLLAALSVLHLSGCSPQTGPEEFEEESYAHVRASWSRNGSTIAFNGTVAGVRGVYVVDTAASSIALVKEGEGIGVTWSPDDQWLAFSALQSIYKIRTTGDSLTRLTGALGAVRPAWSPYGDSIVFVRYGLWILDLGSSTEQQILSGADFPSWYSDARRVLFLNNLPSSSGDIIYSFDSYECSTGNVMTQYAFSSKASCGYCSVNRDGNAIVFAIKFYGKRAEVWKADLSFGTSAQLTDDGGDYPAWSPDGMRIVYTRTQKGDGGLWIMNADGSGKRRLTAPD